MAAHNDSTVAAIAKTLLAILAWFGSWKIGEVQALLGIVTALVVAGYTGTQWWVLWRDKVKKP